ncbi:MAG: Dam family site-specific DNA-(adenine-N6)-methyltransferase, partial [Oscillospiraceae bacterium]|nr:Dam family site-specific DNA-(adenine-N6)-methyltransferase [Oscillospiraceae bacterium]
MEYMSTREAAALWGITQRRVDVLCSEERIEGAQFIGRMWIIPSDAKKPEDGRVTRFEPPSEMPVKPFVKWAGGKSQLLGEIRAKYPSDLGETITKYAEPFVGGGAVLFDILSRYEMKDVYISDINRELIETYISIRDNVHELILKLKEVESNYLSADETKRKTLYYDSRQRFNTLKSLNDSSIELSTLFIFLNRTCFNGLYRVNSSGAFNVPQGSYKNPTICNEENLLVV